MTDAKRGQVLFSKKVAGTFFRALKKVTGTFLENVKRKFDHGVLPGVSNESLTNPLDKKALFRIKFFLIDYAGDEE